MARHCLTLTAAESERLHRDGEVTVAREAKADPSGILRVSTCPYPVGATLRTSMGRGYVRDDSGDREGFWKMHPVPPMSQFFPCPARVVILAATARRAEDVTEAEAVAMGYKDIGSLGVIGNHLDGEPIIGVEIHQTASKAFLTAWRKAHPGAGWLWLVTARREGA